MQRAFLNIFFVNRVYNSRLLRTGVLILRPEGLLHSIRYILELHALHLDHRLLSAVHPGLLGRVCMPRGLAFFRRLIDVYLFGCV